MKIIKKSFLWLNHVLFVMIIFLLSVFTSLLFAFWQGYPSGYDATGHTFKIYFIAKFWPYIDWLPNWAGGMAHFLRYPSLPFVILGLINRLNFFSPGQLLAGAAVFSIWLGGVGVYLLVYKLTNSKIASLLSVFLYTLSPSTWFLAGSAGGYSRTYAFPFMILSLWATVTILQDIISKKQRYWPYLLATLFLGICFLIHFFIGVFTIMLICGWFLTFVRIIKFKQLIVVLIKIFVPSLLIASPILLPMIILRDPKNGVSASVINWADMRPISWEALFNFHTPNQMINIYDSVKLTPFLYPLAGLLWILAMIFRRRGLFSKEILGRSIIFFTIISLLSLAFARIVSPVFGTLYAGIIDQAQVLFYIPFLVGTLVGCLVVLLLRRVWFVLPICLLIMSAVVLWVSFEYQLPKRNLLGLKKEISAHQFELEYPVIRQVITEPKNFNFRFGTSTDSSLAAWFNIIYPYVPQTRDYFTSGIANIDDDVYKTHSLWESSNNYPETEFILDWFAVNNFVVTPDNKKVVGKYEARSDLFKFIADDSSHKIFSYSRSGPILATTNAPTILIIGRDVYDFVYRAFAQGNLNSRYIIPIVGREKIDDYTQNQLNNFDMILLYNYQYKKRDVAFDRLAKYVQRGGKLLIETNTYVEEMGNLPEPFPIVQANKIKFSDNWNFELTSEFKQIDVSKFAPPVYQNGPWGGASGEAIKNWAKVLVSREGKPIMVGGQIGNGKVLWSGMNLPYHVLNNHNFEEGKFFGSLFAWLQDENNLSEFRTLGQTQEGLSYISDNYIAKFINPQEFRLIPKTTAKGVLFKESSFPGWEAMGIDKDGRNHQLTIFQAGPRMMYIHLPEGVKEIIFRYQVPTILGLTNIISPLVIILLLTKPVWSRFHFAFVDEKARYLKKRMFGWWNRDDET